MTEEIDFLEPMGGRAGRVGSGRVANFHRTNYRAASRQKVNTKCGTSKDNMQKRNISDTKGQKTYRIMDTKGVGAEGAHGAAQILIM